MQFMALLQVPPTQAKMILWLQKNISRTPHDIISRLIMHPNFTSVLSVQGFDPKATLLYTADKFPHFDNETGVAPAPGPMTTNGSVSSPGPGEFNQLNELHSKTWLMSLSG